MYPTKLSVLTSCTLYTIGVVPFSLNSGNLSYLALYFPSAVSSVSLLVSLTFIGLFISVTSYNSTSTLGNFACSAVVYKSKPSKVFSIFTSLTFKLFSRLTFNTSSSNTKAFLPSGVLYPAMASSLT